MKSELGEFHKQNIDMWSTFDNERLVQLETH